MLTCITSEWKAAGTSQPTPAILLQSQLKVGDPFWFEGLLFEYCHYNYLLPMYSYFNMIMIFLDFRLLPDYGDILVLLGYN